MPKLAQATALNLERIFKRIPQLCGVPFSDIKCEVLAGETNKNILLSVLDHKYVLRTPRQTTNAFINRENEAFNSKIAEELELAPINLWRDVDKKRELTGHSLTRYVEHSQSVELSDFKNFQFLKRVSSTLITLQSSKVPFKGSLDKQKISRALTRYFNLCDNKNKTLFKDAYNKSTKLLEEIKYDRPAVPSHGDLSKENILIMKDRIWLIDWEYSAMSSPFWDIAILCNSGGLDENAANTFLRSVLIDHHENDIQCLKHYRFITNTISSCWQAAVNPSSEQD